MIRLVAFCLSLAVIGPLAAQSQQSLTLLRQETTHIVPRYLLQDPNGRSVTSEEFFGRYQLIAFGYTYCPDI
ncbi:MAG TPA: SCO family protein, partial [Azonexus sp.]|nr:SCO family protein [Azonexus sp.]